MNDRPGAAFREAVAEVFVQQIARIGVGGVMRCALSWMTIAAMLASCGGQKTGQNDAPLACPPCPSNAVCVDDPRDACRPDAGGSNCPAVCASQPCGGIRGLVCPQGSTCVDDPRNDCDLAQSADCAGVCAP